MRRLLAALVIVSGTVSVVGAQSSTNPDEVASHLHFWAQESGEPVYYGEVRNVDARGMRILGHYQCLALAFINYENGVFSYAHKMWSKSPDGSCHYEDVTSRKVGNHGVCVKDTDAGFGTAVGTARMTKENIDFAHSIFRTINTKARRVGETAACVPPRGASAGLYAIEIADGRLKVITTFPLDYEVSIDAQDPQNPPTKPVF
jgi:hypothetical protein